MGDIVDSDCSGWDGHAELCGRGQQCRSVREEELERRGDIGEGGEGRGREVER